MTYTKIFFLGVLIQLLLSKFKAKNQKQLKKNNHKKFKVFQKAFEYLKI